MARSKRWTDGKREHGIWEIKLSSWKYLHDFVHQQMLDYEHYIWRGQRNTDWVLNSTFDRLVKGKNEKKKIQILEKHLLNFKYAVRGRRGGSPPKLENDNEWWALGQHQGLATPLLDWTHSPFVALYFSFHKSDSPQTKNRVVYAINPAALEKKSNEILKTSKSSKNSRPQICEFIRPLLDDNPRLVNQGGLFSRSPTGLSIEEWMIENYEKEYNGGVLLKIIIPGKGRYDCLRTLNRMNINHSSLFPDLFGSSEFCNTKVKISKY